VIDRSKTRDTPKMPVARQGRRSVWDSSRGNHLGWRSCANATKSRTYERKRSDQNHTQIFLREGGRSLIASPLSTVLSPPRVTVLSAVGIVRRNIWSEAQALQGPQRADVQGRRSTATNAATRTLARRATITPAFSRGRNLQAKESGGDRVLRPAERLSRTPDAMQDDGELSGQRHPCFANARSLGDRERPILQFRGFLDPRHDHDGSLIQQSARKRVATLRYVAMAVNLA
jgi:hypothetical protein